jgi:hypothetical protein
MSDQLNITSNNMLSRQELSGQELSGQELSEQELSEQELSGQELSEQEISVQDICILGWFFMWSNNAIDINSPYHEEAIRRLLGEMHELFRIITRYPNDRQVNDIAGHVFIIIFMEFDIINMLEPNDNFSELLRQNPVKSYLCRN